MVIVSGVEFDFTFVLEVTDCYAKSSLKRAMVALGERISLTQ